MEPEPENCPGVGTENAGKSSACAGCPNQRICSDPNTKIVDPGKELVAKSMSEVKQKLLVLSGKGGVGKSTMVTLLSRYMARAYPDLNFGVLDIDICGPSQPRMLGVEGENVHQSGSGWSPVGVDDNLCLMSIGFLLGSTDDAIIWRTSDEHLSVISYLHDDNSSDTLRAIIVTTPQEVSLLDVRKEINFCKKQKIPILGVVENMSTFRCGHCGTESEIFPAKTGGVGAMCAEMEVPYLGALPLDPQVTKACDNGDDITNMKNVTTDALGDICQKIYRCF
ncbi:unnamed protein product [Ceratitis capitata]|uniref:(Mediterranean fruit fly) hypothetical protein n=1 Tax=Ceratitis capitata TaxID=7213 RepID=A0A811UK05_CERCA|nr:unnamed protein product [Ceratitis capitata]